MRIAKSILILIFLVLWGCSHKPASNPSKQKIRFAFWGSPEEVKIISSIIADWEKIHPNVDVVLEHTPYGGYASKILTRIAGGDAPDIMAAEVSLFTNFWGKGVFLDLTSFIKNDKTFSLNDFFPPIVDHFTIDGKVYGIPRDVAPFACIYYNKSLFDQAGIPYPCDDWTWDDLLEIAKKLTVYDKNGRVKRYGFYTWAWQNFVLSNGGSLVDDVKHPTELTLDSLQAKEGLQFYVDLIHKYKVSPTPSALINMGMGVQMMFMTGRLAMLGSGIWETPALRNIQNFDWDVVMFPKSPRGIRRFATGGTAYCILKTSKNPKLAWEVVKALTSVQAMERMASTGLAQPARISVAEGPYWAGNKQKPLNKGMLNTAVKYIVFPPFHPRWREVEELYLKPELDLVFNGQKDLDSALEKIVTEGNKILSSK
ncbi:MAG TPA: sugar ABC transporter substrate-binding protein [Candidatus Omnitrophica bacterium]|nr:sugar ABC transporter substrate-binding protein [Candidatus Omnitrophota bacterium]